MKYLLILPGVLVLLVLIAVVRTLVSPRKTSGYQPPQTDGAEALRLAGKLSKMIQVDTTSHAGGDDPARFRAFHKTLAELFPRVFSQLEKTEIDGNLLFYWKGRSQERPNGATRRFPATLRTARSGAAALRTRNAPSWPFLRRPSSCWPRAIRLPRTCISPRRERRNGQATARRSW